MDINLTEEQKKKIVEEANALPQEPEAGLETSVTYAADDNKLVEQIASMTPEELFERNVAASYRSLMKLEGQLQRLSKKNIIKLMLATLKLPDEGMRVNFGGTKADIENATQAFVQAQVARNSFVFVTGTQALFKAKLAKKQEEQPKGDKNEQV